METEPSFNLFRFLEELLIPLVEFIGLDAIWANNILVIVFLLTLLWIVLTVLHIIFLPVTKFLEWLDSPDAQGCWKVFWTIILLFFLLISLPFMVSVMSTIDSA